MHSEQTELHLLHMVERAQMGMQGEEKEIEELLFDEVYTLVYTIYKEDEKTRKAVHAILKRYVEGLRDRKILDIHKNVQVYAILRIYQALNKKNGELYTRQDSMKEYEYAVIADDTEFEAVADTYADAFESIHAYRKKPEAFRKMKAEKMILAALYMYEKCTVDEISRTLKIDKDIVKNEIATLKAVVMEAGKAKRAEKNEAVHTHHTGTHKVAEEEKGLTDYLFPQLGRGVRTGIDVAASVLVLAAYFLIFR